MEKFPDISIIGPGKVGTALGALAARAGLPVVAVAGGGAGRAEAAAEAIGSGAAACSVAEAAGLGRLVLLTVPDGAIAVVCERLAAAAAFGEGAVVAHCCGALSSEVLAAARERCGCSIGSIHPLQTFPTVAAAMAHLPGTYCFCEGDEAAAEVLERLAEAIGGRAVRIDASRKVLYHAAAATACNYLVALLDAAARLAAAAGIDRATWLAAVEPIVRATVDNVARLGPAEALTGPIARGDVETVARHAAAVGACDEPLRRLYAAAANYTIELARREGHLDASTGDALRRTLQRLAERK
jgi:predicted short-subunit dehydrogenase-like oxidoreductase (DUF2520 family)